MRVIIHVVGCIASAEIDGVHHSAMVGADSESAVRFLVQSLKQELPPDTVYVMPYLGTKFEMEWETIPAPKPEIKDEFDLAQEIGNSEVDYGDN